MNALLEARNITKSFPGVKALQDVSFDLRAGEVHALCGENGAGKSTLMKILSGSYGTGSFEGQLLFNGDPVNFHVPVESSRTGISIVYQELSLVPDMTVAENVFLGREPKSFGIVDRHQLAVKCGEVLKRLEIDVPANELVARLPLGTRQLVEIARALSQNPKVLVLDEPTSALSQKECETLFRLIKRLRADGLGIVLVTHKLDEVFGLSDRITVFRDGKKVGTWETKTLDNDKIIKFMVGREITEFYPNTERNTGEVVMQVKDLTLPHPRFPHLNRLENINFKLHKSEILGIAGLMGSGRSELLMALFGAMKFSGTVELFGKKSNLKNPYEAIRAGLQFATEDRKKTGLNLCETINKNISLASLDKVSTFGVLRSSREVGSSLEYVKSLRVKTPSIHAFVKNLSGGNQQKVVLSKCLMSQPKILFLDEPTRGIDVGAKSEIYHSIHELAKKGMSFVVVSSELPEILGLCDRVLVLCEGRLTAEFKKADATEEKIMHAATQFKKSRQIYSEKEMPL
jgi:D-xylose transport system ATP-binding protein